MSFGILNIVSIIGALGLFIFGMKVMSEAIQKAAGVGLRKVLGAMTSTKLYGIFTGLLITGLVQSSSATTVMLISFVNAGLITLSESITVIMGANLGTTVTAWLVAVLDMGKLSITALSLPLIALAFPLLFFTREKFKLWGEVLIGFAILFLGLALLRESLPNLESNPQVLSFLQDFSYQDKTYLGKIGIAMLFVLAGFLITIIVQSSSAAIALTLVLTSEGWISFPLAAAIVLGENIGTTITANIAAVVANVHAKRAARSHFLFNFLGVLWAVLALPLFLALVASISVSVFNGDPFTSTSAIPLALCVFHSLFNFFNILIFYGLTNRLAKLSEWMVRSKSDEDEMFSLDYIGSGLMATPELSIMEARKELVKFGDLMRRAFKYIPLLITEMDEKKLHEYTEKLQKYEDISDRMEMEISNYLSQASRGELSSDGSARVRMMLHVANYLERIGDIYLEVSRNLTTRKEQKAYFTPDMRSKVIQLAELVARSLDQMVRNLESNSERIDLQAAQKLESEVNATFQNFRADYIAKVEKGKFRVQSGMYYSDLLAELERIADHAISISNTLARINANSEPQ